MAARKLSFLELEALWIRAGGDAKRAPTMAAIALAESGGNTAALNDNASTRDYSVSPWQINYFGDLYATRAQRYGTPAQLLADPLRAARAAVDLANTSTGLNNWSTYKSGAYKTYLEKPTPVGEVLQPASANVDLNNVDPGLLGRLYALGTAIKRTITLTSGARDWGDVPNSKHIPTATQGALAVDATIGGKPIALVVPEATLNRYGLQSGNVAGFDPQKPGGYDPVHVYIDPSQATPGFGAAAATARNQASWNPGHWLQSAADYVLGHPGAIVGGVLDPFGTAVGTGVDKVTDVLGIPNPLDWTGQLTGWVESKVGYAVVYGMLVLFAIVLALLGVLSLLGIKPSTAIAGARLAKVAA